MAQGVGDKVPAEPAAPRGLGVATAADGRACLNLGVAQDGLGRQGRLSDLGGTATTALAGLSSTISGTWGR